MNSIQIRLDIQLMTNFFNLQPIDKVWVFGSFAKSEEKIDSDVDLLVKFTPNAKISIFKYVFILEELKSITHHNIDLVEESQLRNEMKTRVNNEKILIYERKTKG